MYKYKCARCGESGDLHIRVDIFISKTSGIDKSNTVYKGAINKKTSSAKLKRAYSLCCNKCSMQYSLWEGYGTKTIDELYSIYKETIDFMAVY